MKSYVQKNSKIKYSDNWKTPSEIYDHYIIGLGCYDPCPYLSNNIIDLEKDFINERLFVNPPYSQISKWVDWCIICHTKYNKEIIMLIPARTDTKYFHKLLNYGVDLVFIKGRLKFNDSKNNAPFPSLLIKLYER